MRGHAKIELTNIKTGETEVVEHSNMFTNALQEIMKPVGKMLFTTISETTAHYCKYLTGLVCFGEPIEENPEIILPPVGNDIIAYGTNYAYTGRNTMCGSFNVVDSTKENDKDLNPDADIKLVWEFAGNQGNGTISCLSLTSQKAPMYSMFGSKAANPDVMTSRPGNVTVYINNFDDYRPMVRVENTDRLFYADYQNNALYFVSQNNFYQASPENIVTTGKIKLKRLKTSLSSVLLRQPEGDRLLSEEIIEYVYIDIPEEIRNTFIEGWKYIFGGVYSDEGYFYCYFKPSISHEPSIEIEEVLKILKVRVSDWSTQVINVKNTTGSKCRLSYIGSEPFPSVSFMAITNNYLLLSSASGIYSINLSNNADVTKIKNPEETGDLIGRLFGLFVVGGKMYFKLESSSSNYMIFDPETKKTYYTEVNVVHLGGSAGTEICNVSGSPLLCICADYDRYGYYSYKLTKLPFYIATINNLDVPVVKTPAQTMKITYTLTSKAEELPEQE